MFVQSLVTLLVIIANIFIYCYFGQNVTTKFSEVADIFYELHWYDYPMTEQKYVIMMLTRAQRPFYFSGYFISSCSLPTFKLVSTNEDSYKFVYYILILRFVDYEQCFHIFYGAQKSGMKN